MAKTANITYERQKVRSPVSPEATTQAFMNAAERARKREKERARILGRGPFGFSRKTWPFVKVLVSTWIFSLVYYVGVKEIVTWRPDYWSVADRLALMIQCSIVSLVPAIAAIAVVATQRLNPDMWIGQEVKRYSALDINNRFILNTVEQFILFVVGLSGIALFAPFQEAHSIPVLTSLFLLGRALFWYGYHKNPYLRAFGFGITFYPTIGVYIWLLIRMLTGYHIPI